MLQSLPRQTREVTENFTPAEIRAALTPRPERMPSPRRGRIIARDRQAETAAYAELGWTTPTRTLASLLLGLSNGNGESEIEISDHELAERYAKGRRNIDPKSAERQIRRMRIALYRDQEATGLFIIGVREGTEIEGPDGVKRVLSRYHVGRLLDLLATLTTNPPRVLSDDRRRRAEAWQRAAAAIITHLAADEGWSVPSIARRTRRNLSIEERIERAVNTAAGHAYSVWDLTWGETDEERAEHLTSEIKRAVLARVSVRPFNTEEGEDSNPRPTEIEAPPRCGPLPQKQADTEADLPLDFGDNFEPFPPDNLSSPPTSQLTDNGLLTDSGNAAEAHFSAPDPPLDELSFEASDAANWVEEVGADNDSEEGGMSLFASFAEPPAVSAPIVADETPGPAALPNQNDEDLPPLSAMGQAAVEYARLGYFVVPNHYLVTEKGEVLCSCKKGAECPKPGKHPRWRPELMADGINSASSDPAVVRQMWTLWPQANIGFECSERSGVFAHDFDGEAGRALFEKMRAAGDIPDDALIQRTGGGGFHVLSRYERIEGLSNWSKPDGAPFDVRGAKKAAQVIVAPSRHISGASYEWLTDYKNLAPMSAGLRALLVDAVKQMRAARPAAVGARAATGISKGSVGTLSVIYPEGERNNQLHAYASWLRGVRGFNAMEIFEELRARNQEACRPPLDDDEVRQIAASAARYAPGVAYVGGGR